MARKLLTAILIAAALLAGSVFAAQQLAPYPAAYWVNGVVNAGASGLTDLSGFKVIFYKVTGDTAAAYADATTDIYGQFKINAMDDLRMLPLSTTTYFIGVVNKGGYGVNQKDVIISTADLNNGYRNLAADLLSLAAGEGVTDPEINLHITISALPNATVGQPYSAIVSAEGGTDPLTWSITSGDLPPGITLNTSNGLISGTPSTAGTYNITIRVTDATGQFVEANLTLSVTYAIQIIAYGPQIKPTLLYQALANTTTFSHAAPKYVRIEARSGVSPDTATTIVGYADVILDQSGNTTGMNGFLKPDGTEFGAVAPLPNGDYYLAIKQWLTPTLVGIGHLSAITSRKITLYTGADTAASTTRLELTGDTLVIDDPATRVYNETCYAPSGKPPALITANGRTLLRAGDMDGNNYIDVVDTSHWYRLFTRFNATGEDDPADPFIRSDLDQNGLVDVIDTSWWYGSFNNLVLELNDPGPHGYVPAVTP